MEAEQTRLVTSKPMLAASAVWAVGGLHATLTHGKGTLQRGRSRGGVEELAGWLVTLCKAACQNIELQSHDSVRNHST